MAEKAKRIIKSKYSNLEDMFVKNNQRFFQTGEARDVFGAISHGDNSYLRINRIETSAFDSEWIKQIEDTIPELETIVTNPRRNIGTVGYVVPVELAKRTTSESVRHLAQHTQYVKEIKANGDVIPSKILTIASEDEYGIYENRFIATLIRRLVLFVEKRYEFVVQHALLKDTEELKMKSKSVVDGSVVEMETKVKIVKPADYDGIEERNGYVQRIIKVRDHLRFCYTSSFMKIIKTEKNVRNPIIMTNIIRKNPLYHKCYLLWRYLDGYTSAGVNYSVNDSFAQLDEEAIKEINMALTSSFLAARSSKPSKFATLKPKVYKPKILTSIDDEEFEYGPYLEGPVEFVRVDEEYRKASETTTSFYREEDIYNNTAKEKDEAPKREIIKGILKAEEEEYIKEFRLENRSIELMREAKDQLMTRKRRACAAFDKAAIKQILKREQEERARQARIAEEQRLEQLLLAKEARKRLIQTAKNDFAEDNEVEKFKPQIIPEELMIFEGEENKTEPENTPIAANEVPEEIPEPETPKAPKKKSKKVEEIKEEKIIEEPIPEPEPVVEEIKPEAPIEEPTVKKERKPRVKKEKPVVQIETPVEEKPIKVRKPRVKKEKPIEAEPKPEPIQEEAKQPEPVVVEEVPTLVEEPVVEALVEPKPAEIEPEPAPEPEPIVAPAVEPAKDKETKTKVIKPVKVAYEKKAVVTVKLAKLKGNTDKNNKQKFEIIAKQKFKKIKK